MKKRQIFVDLTPLLDVILIMLFVILLRSGAAVDAAETQSAALRQELTEAEESLAAMSRHERTLGVVEDESLVLTLSLQNTAVRRIRIESDAADPTYITLDTARYPDAAERLHTALRGAILASGHEAAFLVFQFDRNAIYEREYELISGVIRALKPELGRQGIYLGAVELDYQKEQ